MPPENMTDRLVALESSLAHLQHDFEQVHHPAAATSGTAI
jgi:hypothetical protein